MKTLLSDTNGYRVFVEVNCCDLPKNSYEVKFSTTWDRAADPDMEHVKFRMILTEDQLQDLKAIL